MNFYSTHLSNNNNTHTHTHVHACVHTHNDDDWKKEIRMKWNYGLIKEMCRCVEDKRQIVHDSNSKQKLSAA